MTNWLSVRVHPGAAHRDDALAALFEMGSEGVHEDGAELVTHFPGDADAEAIAAAVVAADPGANVTCMMIPAVDWTEKWKAGVRAHELGVLAVVPPWLAEGRDMAHTIVIEPQMAFGTGEHQTTRGVLRLMPDVIRPGDRVVDLGSGSAVLAIAAAKLGASRVTAIEMDPDAIDNANENIVRNDVGDRVTQLEGDAFMLLPLVAPTRVIFANIISSVLLELLPVIADALEEDGTAILSGILGDERGMMVEALTAAGWSIVAEDAEELWWSVRIARR